MNLFLAKASDCLSELCDLVDESSKRFLLTMRFYQFRPKEGKLEDTQPKDFFHLWYPFCRDFKDLWKREQVRIEKEILKEERLRYKQKKDSLKSFKTEALKPKGLKEKMLRRKSKMNAGGQ